MAELGSFTKSDEWPSDSDRYVTAQSRDVEHRRLSLIGWRSLAVSA
jgi:hypothetical protein